MQWLLSNASSRDIIDCVQKGKSDTKMFKNDLFIKRNRNYEQKWTTVVVFQKKTPRAVPREKNTKGQYHCEPDLEIEVYL